MLGEFVFRDPTFVNWQPEQIHHQGTKDTKRHQGGGAMPSPGTS
jgi:hypothetical protein